MFDHRPPIIGKTALVTGCAGFIGSHLTQKLLDEGYEVFGIDCFRDYYPPALKEYNISGFMNHPLFTLIREDICSDICFPDVDYVFHLAAQAGVRSSWGMQFGRYLHDNIAATQKLLEWYKDKNILKFVYSSSSSVYGDVSLPMNENQRLQPVSPYGVTKLAGEHLCSLYWKNFQLPTISLRYFTVYGPHQRPDMAINKFVSAILHDKPITLYGDGTQTRDFTYVSDVVDANLKAIDVGNPGSVYNIGGGSRITVKELIYEIEMNCGKLAQILNDTSQKGDVVDTLADVTKAKKELMWIPQVSIQEGIRKYVSWLLENTQRGNMSENPLIS